MTGITFAEAYLTLRDRLTADQLRVLEPRCDWFRAKDAILGLRFMSKDKLWMDMAVSTGPGWLFELMREARAVGVTEILFQAADTDKRKRLLLKMGGEYRDDGETYADGTKCLSCRLPTSRRT